MRSGNCIKNTYVTRSSAVIYLWVSRATKMEELEKLLAEAAQLLRKKSPDIKGAPVLIGIEDFSATNVKIRIDTPCTGKGRFDVQRLLRHELKTLFEAYGIYRACDP